jgi:hypothetical protein
MAQIDTFIFKQDIIFEPFIICVHLCFPGEKNSSGVQQANKGRCS